MESALQRHDEVFRSAIEAHGGYAFKALGDAFCAAFARPSDAVAAMLDAQLALNAADFSSVGGLPVRVAIHTGTADERGGDYFGPAVNRVARMLVVAHGGQILCSAATAAVVQADLPSQTSVRDLGEHALKDLDSSEHIFQVVADGLRADFPPLRSTGSRAHLPPQLTSFVGRERELAELATLIREHRLVTLIGSGGVGKTRTALHVAADVAGEFADGAWSADLGALAGGEHVAATVAHAIGIALPAGGDPLDSLSHALKAKRMLLVLDNCEHLAKPIARVVTALLRGSPHLKILASSRQPLGVSGEQTYHLPSLDAEASVELFAQRARAVDERSALTAENEPIVADICRRLDGIPLAIELAASRAAVLSVKQISERLNERFRLLAQKGGDRLPRQQTLRATIDWSYDLLDADERTVFARFSVFAGGWTLAAATTVCCDDAIDEWQMLDLLATLVAKSLVVSEPSGGDRRYRMLNSIREYSRERLVADGQADAIASKHAAYYVGFAGAQNALAAKLEDERWQRALAPEIDNIRAAIEWTLGFTAEQTELASTLEDERWQQVLAPELANIRGAIEWTIGKRHDAATGLRLLAQFEWPELVTTPQEAVRWYDAASAVLDVPIDDSTRARVLRHHARLEWLVGRPTAQIELRADHGLAAARASGNPDAIGFALTMLAGCYRDAQRFDDAERIFEEAFSNASLLAPITLNTLLRNWAITSLQRGDIEAARRRFTEVAQRERPGSEAHASALMNIGELEFAVGNVEGARAAARQARPILERLDAAPLGLAICNLTAYAMSVDEVDEARDLLREALEILIHTGARWRLTALEHAALLAALLGDFERAALLTGHTSAQYANDDTRQTTERIGYERLMRMLRETYGQEELAARLEVGAQLDDEQALAHVSAILESKPAAAAPAAEKRE